jgi:hypothetical protein
MVAMAVLCGIRIRYSCLIIHPIGSVLVGGVEEGGYSSSRRFYGVVDLIQSMYDTSLVLETSRSIQGFNGDDFSSRALVLRGTCKKISRLSSTTSG